MKLNLSYTERDGIDFHVRKDTITVRIGRKVLGHLLVNRKKQFEIKNRTLDRYLTQEASDGN